MIVWFHKEDIIYLHSTIIEKTGGQEGIRDEGMLESSILNPLQSFDGRELYPTIIDKLIRLSFGLVKNHPFLDGNKRIGAFALAIGMKLNDIDCQFENHDAIHTFFSLADGNLSYEQFAEWVQSKIH